MERLNAYRKTIFVGTPEEVVAARLCNAEDIPQGKRRVTTRYFERRDDGKTMVKVKIRKRNHGRTMTVILYTDDPNTVDSIRCCVSQSKAPNNNAFQQFLAAALGKTKAPNFKLPERPVNEVGRPAPEADGLLELLARMKPEDQRRWVRFGKRLAGD